MAKKRNLDDALEAYKGGGAGFFSLVNDKDTAVMRILVGESLVAEEDWFVVHEIQVDSKKRYVQCTEEEDCEGCLKNKPQIKLFLQLEDPKTSEITVWERGRTFIPKINDKITSNGPLYNRLYEIERNGIPNDPKTFYELYGYDRDGITFEQMCERKQKLLGEKDKNGLVLNLSRDNMRLAMQGKFSPPKSEDSGTDQSPGDSAPSQNNPVQRRERTSRAAEDVF